MDDLFVMPLVAFFFFNDTATTEIYTLSLHDALPIWLMTGTGFGGPGPCVDTRTMEGSGGLYGTGDDMARWLRHNLAEDRKSTRLNSSHANISYAVFCLKKKNTSYTSHS